ncbi:hypothetical protein KKP04_11855 [Rhodomicrobium sp. Az07]|uniref:hypothetical protein n=1 Tax=Rhodomicrobium sp. Az07 TaxID=2839034 RepID=UPI001BEA837B|nr:hypothetical protein [Rhodomicrobium sp. Az07]MBT3071560.1 hypothetical protein [Rhodomicrobium sp. Az07]
MASHPLSHHEILGLVAPFTRRGLHPDLQATDRQERRLVFKRLERVGETEDAPFYTETLELRCAASHATPHKLTRTTVCSTAPEKFEARLEIEGRDLADMLACIDTVSSANHFRFGPGFSMVKSWRLLRGSGETVTGLPATQKILTHMSATLGDLTVTATAPTVKADPETIIEIQPPNGAHMRLPDDLLAVLGWNWSLIRKRSDTWRGILKTSGREPDRSRRAELNLDKMVEHLVETFSDAPARFHDRLYKARWGVAFRRSLPLLISLTLIGLAALSSRLELSEDSVLRMLIFNAPPLLMASVFCMRRLPLIEIPPMPRRLKAPQWVMEPA